MLVSSIKNLKKNKRAQIHILFLVLLTLSLFIFIIFSFRAEAGKTEKRVYAVAEIDKLYSQERQGEVYLRFISKKALAETYEELAKESWFIDRPNQVGVYYVFRAIVDEETLSSEFEKRFRVNFANELAKYKEASPVTAEFLISLIKDGIEVKFSEGGVALEFKGSVKGRAVDEKGWIKKEKKEIFSAIYYTDIRIGFSFEGIGLASFQQIYSDVVVGEERELDSFDIVVSDYRGKQLVTLTSKKKFFIDDDFENIKIDFLLG